MALINVPIPGQTLANSRDQINSNFSVIDTAFQVDHVDYNITNQGMHNRVSFPTQSVAPIPAAGILQVYSKQSTLTSQPELVFTRQTGSTAPSPIEFTSAGYGNAGWTRLPSGILFQWRSGISMASVSTVSVTLNSDVAGSPGFTQVYSVFLTPTNPASSLSYNTVIAVQSIAGSAPFMVTFAELGLVRPPSGYTIAYLAIGV